MYRRPSTLALALALSAAAPAVQAGEDLPAPIFQAELDVPGGASITFPGTHNVFTWEPESLDGCQPKGPCGHGDYAGDYLNGKSVGSVDFSDSGGLAAAGMGASVTVSFWVSLWGPQPMDVPLDFHLSANTSIDGGHGESLVDFAIDGEVFRACSVTAFADCSQLLGGVYAGTSSSISTSIVRSVHEGSLFIFEASAVCGFDASSAAGSCRAAFDPEVTIDPSFTLPGYTLQFSPNPISDVPEPSPLVLAGLGLLVLLARRGRRDT